MRARLPSIALAGALATACHPCPDGVYYGGVRVRDNVVVRDSLYSQDPLGTTGDSPIGACRELTGGVTFTGTYNGVGTFHALERVGGSVGFTDLDEEVFADFPLLQRVEGRIYTLNARIDDMFGFDVLEEVGTIDFTSGGPQRLHSMGTLRSASRILMDGDPEVVTSETWPISELDEIWVRLTSTRSLRFLSNVETVTEDVILSGPTLGELGLERLERIGGSLEIVNTRIGGFGETASLRAVGENVTIVGNVAVSDADATEWLDGVDVGGAVRVCGNGPIAELTACPPLTN